MLFNIGDLVTRKSHNHDMVFKIKDINNNIVILEGVNIRLIADAYIDDLEICKDCEEEITKEDRTLLSNMSELLELNRDNYFYLPGKILHIDGDKGYLDRCTEFYKNMNIVSYGVISSEDKIYTKIVDYLEEINPDVLVITGHDAYYENNNDDYKSISNYKNINIFRSNT